MTKEEIIQIDSKHYMPVFTRYPVVLEYGEGPYVFDIDGKKYLDFLAGIAVNLLGHAHPALIKAISAQAAKIIHCSNLYYTRVQAQLIAELAKASGLDRVFLANSGAEANEGAIKLARKYGKAISAEKIEIITAVHSFHGRTVATLTATGQEKYQKGYEPLPQGFTYAAFNDIAALEAAISEKTCAVMLEPVQGEGGIYVPHQDYLAGVKKLCDQFGALLILDEIQTGMARTGKMFAFEHFGVRPDILTIAKGLGGGIPIGAFLATEKVSAAFAPGDHGSTFGGNPLACSAALAVLKAIEEEKLLGNVQIAGDYLMEQLKVLQQKYPNTIKEVRGLGLMAGVELYIPGKEIVAECLNKGLLINCTAEKVLRFVPPLIINKKHVDEMIGILEKTLQ